MKYSESLIINKGFLPSYTQTGGEANHQRLFGLDLLRAASILIVLLAHTIRVISNSELGTLIGAYSANVGVEFFFILSGFLIGTIIIKIHNKQPFTSFESIKSFWIRRWFRTLPNYYLILSASILILAVGHHSDILKQTKLLLFFFFLQNAISNHATEFYTVSWSLIIEEWFYLLFPLVLFCVQFAIRSKPLSLLFTIFLFIFLPLLARIVLAHESNLDWDAGFRKLMPLRLDSIAIGVLSAFFHFYYYKIWTTYKYTLLTLGIIAFSYLMIGFYLGTLNTFSIISRAPLVWPGFSLKTFYFTFLDLSIAMFLPFLSSIKNAGNNAFCKGVTFVSTISYSLYLSHPIIIGLALHFFKGYDNLFMFASMWLFSLVGSYLLYSIFEKRMTSLRERFSDRRYATGVS